jgi:hypothetical protein
MVGRGLSVEDVKRETANVIVVGDAAARTAGRSSISQSVFREPQGPKVADR